LLLLIFCLLVSKIDAMRQNLTDNAEIRRQLAYSLTFIIITLTLFFSS